VRGEAGVGVIWIERVGSILPNESVQEALGFELLLQPDLVWVRHDSRKQHLVGAKLSSASS